MLPCYRGGYATQALSEVVKKARVPFELLVWLNVDHGPLEARIRDLQAAGERVEIVGKTPENIGMASFAPMIDRARGDVLIQLEDDVLFVNRGADLVASEILARRPEIFMLSAQVWQDELTNGGHPLHDTYTCVDPIDQLFHGPIDGGFTAYPRRAVSILRAGPFYRYFGLGAQTHGAIERNGFKAYECRKMKIFHVIGAHYHSAFEGAVDFELSKYRSLGKENLVSRILEQTKTLPPLEYVQRKILAIQAFHDTF